MKLGHWYWEEDVLMLICFIAALLGLLMQIVIDLGGALVALWLVLTERMD